MGKCMILCGFPKFIKKKLNGKHIVPAQRSLIFAPDGLHAMHKIVFDTNDKFGFVSRWFDFSIGQRKICCSNIKSKKNTAVM